MSEDSCKGHVLSAECFFSFLFTKISPPPFFKPGMRSPAPSSSHQEGILIAHWIVLFFFSSFFFPLFPHFHPSRMSGPKSFRAPFLFFFHRNDRNCVLFPNLNFLPFLVWIRLKPVALFLRSSSLLDDAVPFFLPSPYFFPPIADLSFSQELRNHTRQCVNTTSPPGCQSPSSLVHKRAHQTRPFLFSRKDAIVNGERPRVLSWTWFFPSLLWFW